MTMYEDSHEHKQITVECKFCDKFIAFMQVPKQEPIVGDFYCNLKCINDHEKKMKKEKENITEKTLSG